MTKTVYPKFVAPSIAAETFGVTLQTLRRWARAGKISFIKTPTGQHRYNIAEHIGLMSAPAAPKRAPQPKVITVTPPPAVPVAALAKPVAKPVAPAKAQAPAPMLDPAMLRKQIEALAAG